MAIHSILATEVLAASVATTTGRKIFEHYILKGLSTRYYHSISLFCAHSLQSECDCAYFLCNSMDFI